LLFACLLLLLLEYKDDSDLIPRSTSVIVRRMPPVAPGKGTAQRYIKGVMGVVGGAQMATDRGGLTGRIEPSIAAGGASGTRK
jgi:protein MPE1